MNISNLSGLSFTPLTVSSNPTKITESPSTGEKLTLSTSKPIEHVFQPPQNFSQQSVSNPTEASEVTKKLAAQLNPEESKNRFKGMGTRFNELLNRNSNSYSQELRQFNYYSHDKNAATVDFSKFEDLSKHTDQSLTLEIKTKSGATVTFSIESSSGYGKNPDELLYEFENMTVHQVGQNASFRNTEVNFNVSGNLTEQERKQLAEFSENLEAFSNGYFEDGSPDLKKLDLASFDSISNLSIQGFGSASKPVSLEYTNNDEKRSISLSFEGNKAEIDINKNNQFVFSQEGKEQALERYLDILKDSATEARADNNQQKMMLDVLSTGFELSEKELTEARKKEGERTLLLNSEDASDAEKSNDAFIPLPDFSFKFESLKERPNQNQPQEYSGFDVELSLNTEQHVDKALEETEQNQHFKLSGAYYDPLGYLEKPDFANQTYGYTSFEREVNKTVTTEVKSDQLVSAEMKESGTSSSDNLLYSKGVLIDQDPKNDAFGALKDLTEELAIKAENTQLDILKDVLIDPFKDH